MGMYFDDNDSVEIKFTSIDNALNGLCERFDNTEEFLRVLLGKIDKLTEDFTDLSLKIQTSLINEKVEANVNEDFSSETKILNPTLTDSLEAKSDPHPIGLEIRYLGAPSGAGFEVMNERTEKNISTLYILEIDRAEKIAYFYPNKENLSQLIYDKQNLLNHVCDVEGVLTSDYEFNIQPQDYGVLMLESDYWKLKKKCLIKC